MRGTLDGLDAPLVNQALAALCSFSWLDSSSTTGNGGMPSLSEVWEATISRRFQSPAESLRLKPGRCRTAALATAVTFARAFAIGRKESTARLHTSGTLIRTTSSVGQGVRSDAVCETDTMVRHVGSGG